MAEATIDTTEGSRRPARAPSRANRLGTSGPRRFWQRAWFHRLATWGGLLLLWEWFAHLVGPYFFPSLGSIADGFVTVVADGGIQLVAQSFQQMLLGLGLAIVVGVPIGLVVGSFRSVEWLIGPYINLLFVTSLSAALPLLILFFGTGFQFRVAVVFLFAVFYVIINPANGVRAIDVGTLHMSRSFGAGPIRKFVTIVFPGTMPFIISGVRLGLGQAVQGMIIAELWVTVGTGRALKSMSMQHELGRFFALAAIVVVIGTILAQLVLWLQKRMTPWSADTVDSMKGAG